jgi:hypothetical protein
MGRKVPDLKCRRDAVLSALLVLAATAPVAAQAPGGSSGPSVERRETIIGGKPAPTLERCVEVEIGRDSSFGCLNQMLRREADRANPSINLPPIDARSADVRVGNVNEAAVRQQYGANYGRSAIPYRPPTSTFVLPRR